MTTLRPSWNWAVSAAVVVGDDAVVPAVVAGPVHQTYHWHAQVMNHTGLGT